MSKNEIEHIAALAKLKFTPAELELVPADLSKVLSYLDIIKQVDTQEIDPQLVNDASNSLRDDKIMPSLPVAISIANAHIREKNMFSVPKVIEK